jgi:hypothetical protein
LHRAKLADYNPSNEIAQARRYPDKPPTDNSHSENTHHHSKATHEIQAPVATDGIPIQCAFHRIDRKREHSEDTVQKRQHVQA